VSATETWFGIEIWTDLASPARPDGDYRWWSSGTRFATPGDAAEAMSAIDPDCKPRVVKFTLTREVL
jgi:hypothetical protein